MDFTLIVSRIASILNFTVQYKKLPPGAKNGLPIYLHSAFVANENISGVGAGNLVRSANQDAARKLLYIILYNYHAKLLELLERPPTIKPKN